MKIKERLRNSPIAQENIERIEGNTHLKTVLRKHAIPFAIQREIKKILVRSILERYIEKLHIESKGKLRTAEQINLKRLGEDVYKLLDCPIYNVFQLTDERIKDCKKIIDAAISSEKQRREILPTIKKITQKRTTTRIKKSEKNLHFYTPLIEILVRKLKSVFRHRQRDWGKGRKFIKERTFQAVADLINATFSTNFTPEQVKSRCRK